ncbi:MAG: HU family DNA-binding protein [Elusimicrobia bacterium]|nr:HU family DNA-binding protein [Elusimicrobiota bacterium]
MNKQDLSIDVAVKFFLTQVESEKIIDFILEDITKFLIKNKRVYFRGFGTFTRKRKKARRIRHPGTGKIITIPAYYTVKFIPSKKLQKRMNN